MTLLKLLKFRHDKKENRNFGEKKMEEYFKYLELLASYDDGRGCI